MIEQTELLKQIAELDKRIDEQLAELKRKAEEIKKRGGENECRCK